jgi:hypothetical protein
MADKRDQILTRLEAVLTDLVSAKCFRRNDTNVPTLRKNRIVLLDGDEEADPEHVRPKQAERGGIFVAKPEVFLLCGDPDTAGTKLNVDAAALIKTVVTDAELLALCYEGDIRYLGRFTGFAAGRSIEAEARFDFEFRYFMRPATLEA